MKYDSCDTRDYGNFMSDMEVERERLERKRERNRVAANKCR